MWTLFPPPFLTQEVCGERGSKKQKLGQGFECGNVREGQYGSTHGRDGPGGVGPKKPTLRRFHGSSVGKTGESPTQVSTLVSPVCLLLRWVGPACPGFHWPSWGRRESGVGSPRPVYWSRTSSVTPPQTSRWPQTVEEWPSTGPPSSNYPHTREDSTHSHWSFRLWFLVSTHHWEMVARPYREEGTLGRGRKDEGGTVSCVYRWHQKYYYLSISWF